MTGNSVLCVVFFRDKPVYLGAVDELSVQPWALCIVQACTLALGMYHASLSAACWRQ